MNARQGWNAAQLASERRSVKRKTLAPVGVEERPQWDDSCLVCGYHNCPPTCIGPENYARGTAGEKKWLKRLDEFVDFGRMPWLLPATGGPVRRCNAPALCNCDKCWFASPASQEREQVNRKALAQVGEPALLTYDQAVAACREGKRVKDCSGTNITYSFDGQLFLFEGRSPSLYFGSPNPMQLPQMQFRVVP
jgi:hypothetical protein